MSYDGNSSIRLIDDEISLIEGKICNLKKQLMQLKEQKSKIQKKIEQQSTEKLSSIDWECTNFKWSDGLIASLQSVFNLNTFRSQQLGAINATMSGYHALVVMPTGAGKSLCYQLPSLLTNGRTIVVSPLISLMEDQVMSLKKLNIPAKILCSSTSKSESTIILNELADPSSTLKLLYITPERLAKSKRFVAKLQKCFSEGLLQRIAIDEVHCCSQWGHDFRPDYKFLNVLSSLFPKIPILGLTATATTRVLEDVQDMLNIRGCIVIKSSFNRPNLFYQIVEKPSSLNECLSFIENLLRYRYKGETGIIYVTTIKECEDLTTGLRCRGLKVGCYHANLEPDQRSTIHCKWLNKHYQAVVATVAFGMGIDKSDVRFVLHYSLSKSMENYYQESGRSGRDGQRAECVMMYRFQDVFKLSTMVFSTVGGLDHLYGMVKYCLESNKCRRSFVANHFNELWGDDCQEMCDRCCQKQTYAKTLNISKDCVQLCKIIKNANLLETKLTAQKLIDAWLHKGQANLRIPDAKCLRTTRVLAESIVAHLLVEGYLMEDYHFTAYSTISYIKTGPNEILITDPTHEINMDYKEFMKFDSRELASKVLPEINKEKKTASTTKLKRKRKLNDSLDRNKEVIDITDDAVLYVKDELNTISSTRDFDTLKVLTPKTIKLI